MSHRSCYLQRQKGVLSRRLWLFSEQVFRNPKFKERVLGKQEKVPGTGMRREWRFSYSQQEEPRAKGSGNPECRRRRGRPPRPADRALRCLRDAPRVSVPRPQLQGKTFQPRGGSEGNSASFRPESFHVWKNAIARSIVTGVPWRLWGSAQRDAGATGRCPLKGVGAGGEVLEGNVDGAPMPLSLRVTASRSHTGSSHSKVKCGQSACSRGRSRSGLSRSWPRTRTTVLPPHSST